MKIKIYAILALTLFLSMLPLTIRAGGMMLYEISSPDTRLASAGWSSRAEDPSTLFTNPAGMSRFSCSEVQFGVQALNAHIVFDPNFETTVVGSKGNASNWFPAGGFFYVQPLNECFTMGLGLLSYFGADLNFNSNWVGRYYIVEAFLEGFSTVPAISYKFNDCLSFGLGANIMYGVFRQKSHINNALDGLPDGNLRLRDEDIAFGGVAGVLYEFSPCTRVGIQYLSPVKLRFKDTPRFTNIGPTLETVLTRTGLLNSIVHVNARVPQSVMVSGYHTFNSCISMMADIGWQQWSQFQKVTVNLSGPDAISLSSKQQYKDTWHAAVGAEYYLDSCWTLSGGVAYDSSAVSNSERPLDFPVGNQWRFGTGARWYYSDSLIFDLCYELQWCGNLSVNVNKGPLTGRVVGKYNNLYVQFINANLTWAF